MLPMAQTQQAKHFLTWKENLLWVIKQHTVNNNCKTFHCSTKHKNWLQK